MTDQTITSEIPFRLRIGVVGEIPDAELESLRGMLLPEVMNLFDAKSKTQIANAKHTELLLTFVPLKDGNETKVDLFLTDGKPGPTTEKILGQARQRIQPVITISNGKQREFTVEKGHGLNAHSVAALERFNRYEVKSEQESYIQNVYDSLYSDDDGLPAEVKALVREKLLPFYVRASLLAKSSQKIYRRAGLVVYSFSTLAVAAVAIGTLNHDLSPYAFALELTLLLAILAAILFEHRKRAHKNWIEARYVAERVRAAIFLTTCGVETSAVVLPANVGVTGRPDEWMIMTFNEIIGNLPEIKDCHGCSAEKFVAFARHRWLEGQQEFHRFKAESARKKSETLELIGIILFVSAMLAAALHLLLPAIHIEGLEIPLTFLAIVLPAAGAAAGGLKAHREYSRLAARSANMAMSLAALDELLVNVKDPKELSSVLIRVQDLSLLELQDWLMLMSVAKLEASA
jgi:hypothetical protein